MNESRLIFHNNIAHIFGASCVSGGIVCNTDGEPALNRQPVEHTIVGSFDVDANN